MRRTTLREEVEALLADPSARMVWAHHNRNQGLAVYLDSGTVHVLRAVPRNARHR